MGVQADDGQAELVGPRGDRADIGRGYAELRARRARRDVGVEAGLDAGIDAQPDRPARAATGEAVELAGVVENQVAGDGGGMEQLVVGRPEAGVGDRRARNAGQLGQPQVARRAGVQAQSLAVHQRDHPDGGVRLGAVEDRRRPGRERRADRGDPRTDDRGVVGVERGSVALGEGEQSFPVERCRRR